MNQEKQYFFDNPRNVQLMLRVFYAICILLLLLDVVVHRHIYHSWERLWGFYPLYGFVGCVVLVVVAKWMRTFLMRDENYFEHCADCEQESGNGKDSGDQHVAE